MREIIAKAANIRQALLNTAQVFESLPGEGNLNPDDPAFQKALNSVQGAIADFRLTEKKPMSILQALVGNRQLRETRVAFALGFSVDLTAALASQSANQGWLSIATVRTLTGGDIEDRVYTLLDNGRLALLAAGLI